MSEPVVRSHHSPLASLEDSRLLKTKALQHAILNSGSFAIIATDEQGIIQLFNIGAENMLGYSASELVEKGSPADLSDPDELLERARMLSLEFKTEITPGFEALVFKASHGIEDIYEQTFFHKDGTPCPVLVSVTALRGEDERIIGYLMHGTNNSARKQFEAEQQRLMQQLQDQDFYTRSLLESNVDALLATDAAGLITDVNRRMETLTGYSREQLAGTPFKQYFTDPERAETAIRSVLEMQTLSNFELTARSREGIQTVVSLNASTFYDSKHKLQGVFAAARDITELKLFELTLQATNTALELAKTSAEKANHAKSDFLSSMSHELRSPLNAILGFAQLMESDDPSPTPVQSENITQILKAGWHLLKLINEILDLAKIESGQVPLSMEPVSLASILSECQAMTEPLAKKNSIRMIFPDTIQAWYVMGDWTRVKQVFINLFSNAIKYNREYGSVIVKCTQLSPERIRISIRDTGIGLTPEQVSQLFIPFNRLGQETAAIEGTGIGLVMAKRLVELMGGAVHVESTPGIGSTFSFDLDAVAAPELSGLAEDDVDEEIRDLLEVDVYTLLYIEDNPANMKLVEQIIKRHPDIRLLTAIYGNAGIEIARAQLPDVILLDINLPDINGFEVLSILQRDPAVQHIPVIALSANAMPNDVKRGLKAGFFRYLTKPILVNEFMSALNKALLLAR